MFMNGLKINSLRTYEYSNIFNSKNMHCFFQKENYALQ